MYFNTLTGEHTIYIYVTLANLGSYSGTTLTVQLAWIITFFALSSNWISFLLIYWFEQDLSAFGQPKLYGYLPEGTSG